MKKFFVFLISLITISICFVFSSIKFGFLNENDLKNAFNIITSKTKDRGEKISKQIGNKIENAKDKIEITKNDIQDQIREQIARKPRNVKIIATLGKDGYNNIISYCNNGASIFRVNGSHIKSDKQLNKMLKGINTYINNENCKDAEVMYDTQGPEIRILINEKKNKNKSKNKNFISGYSLRAGDIVILHTNLNDKNIDFSRDVKRVNNNPKIVHVGVNYKEFINDVKKDMVITIENRIVYAKIDNINNENGLVKIIITEVNTKDGNYILTDRRHINLIGNQVSQPTLTNLDKLYIQISAINGVKYYAISFVRSKDDIQEVKNLIKQAFILQNSKLSEEELGEKMKEIKIIAKIETQQGLDNLEDILKLADGAMVARGDLGAEIPFEEVPYATDKIIKICDKNNKFSILATDVLLSVLQQDMVSRNDAYMITSALNGGVNSIMLSNETSVDVNKGNKSIKELKKYIDYYNNKKIKGDLS